MMFILILCVIAAFADVIGGALTVFKQFNEQEIMIVTGLGAGVLLGATILDRLPQAMIAIPTTAPLYIIIGYLVLLIIEHYGGGAHRGHDQSAVTQANPIKVSSAQTAHAHTHSTLMSSRAAFVSFVGLLLHTFMDGVVIAGAFTINRSTGVLIFFAITMHKIPEGFSMASISLAAGSSRWRALLTASALALSTLVGALLTLGVGAVNQQLVNIFMALATGTFLFVSTTDMIPAIRQRRTSPIFAAVLGVAVFYVSLLLIKHVGLT